MIRRVIAGFMVLVMLATYVVPADAKIAVVVQKGNGAWDEYSNAEPTYYRDLLATVRGTLDVLGADYDLVYQSLNATKTHWLRTGQIVYGAGTPSAYVKSYDAVLHVIVGTNAAAAYRPDSLWHMMSRLSDTSLTTVRYNTVPQIFVSTNGTLSGAINQDSAAVFTTDMTNQTPLGQVVWSPGSPFPYRAGVSKATVLTSNVSSASGNFRVLLRSGTGAGRWSFAATSTPRVWPDSLGRNDGPTFNSDTAVVYAKTLSTIPSAKPIIFVNHADFQSTHTDMAALLVALAYADSSTGGAVLAGAKNMPVKVGIQIRGGFSRGAQLGIPTSTGGMTIEDSTAFKASIDSLASLNVPMVLGVNVDSLDTYTNYDKRWWANAPLVKYGVYQRAGIDTTVWGATDGKASFDNPRDIFGMWRNRAAFGDSTVHSVQTADTSIAQLVRGAFSKLASTFGSGKVDRILMAPGDDWCPKNGLSMGVDSVVYGLSKGGAKGVVVNPARERIGVYTAGQGFHQRPGNDPLVYNRSRAPFKFLATPSYLDSGSVRFDNGDQGRYPTLVQTERMWRDMMTTHSFGIYNTLGNVQGMSWSTDSTRNVRARILTIHASDLQSGTRGDASTIPLRPGYWVIKNFVNQIKTINSFSYRGKPLFIIAYPEDCEP